MTRKRLVLLSSLAALGGALATTAFAVPSFGKSVLNPPVKIACPDSIPPESAGRPDGWVIIHPQGWLDRANVDPSRGGIQCLYGIDRAQPSARPAFFLNRAVPPNTSNCRVDTGGKSVTCDSAPSVTKPSPILR